MKNYIRASLTIILLTLGLNAYPASTQRVVDANEFNGVQSFENVLSNAGFEANVVKGWTGVGATPARTTTAGQFSRGTAGMSWDAAASGNTLTSNAYTIKSGETPKNGLAYCSFKVASTSTYLIQVYDGTNIVATTSISNNTSRLERTPLNFIYPASGTIALRIYAQANEPVIYIDDCYLGEADNLSQVSQANFVGSAYFAATSACVFTRTSTSLGTLTDTDCPGPTVESNPGPGTIQTTDTDTVKVTVNNLPPGQYMAHYFVGGDTSAATRGAWAINDGTTTAGQTTAAASNSITPSHISAPFTYTATGNRSFELYGSSASGSIDIDNQASNQRVYFYLERFPGPNELAVRADKMGAYWAGYHDTTCSWSTTGTSFATPAADASCALATRSNTLVNFGSIVTTGASTPGITFTPPVAGLYEICAGFNATHTTANGRADIQLYDVTDSVEVWKTGFIVRSVNESHWVHQCGFLYLASVQATSVGLRLAVDATGGTLSVTPSNQSNGIEWTLRQLTYNMPTPVFIGSVTSGSSGQERFERVNVDCVTGTPCTLTRASTSGWVVATRSSTGVIDLAFAAGTFSSAPDCTCAPSSGFSTGICTFRDDSTARTATAANMNTVISTTGAATNMKFDLLCMGPK